jgi:hypothetical protein
LRNIELLGEAFAWRHDGAHVEFFHGEHRHIGSSYFTSFR